MQTKNYTQLQMTFLGIFTSSESDSRNVVVLFLQCLLNCKSNVWNAHVYFADSLRGFLRERTPFCCCVRYSNSMQSIFRQIVPPPQLLKKKLTAPLEVFSIWFPCNIPPIPSTLKIESIPKGESCSHRKGTEMGIEWMGRNKLRELILSGFERHPIFSRPLLYKVVVG